jgi:hypothetical protein
MAILDSSHLSHDDLGVIVQSDIRPFFNDATAKIFKRVFGRGVEHHETLQDYIASILLGRSGDVHILSEYMKERSAFLEQLPDCGLGLTVECWRADGSLFNTLFHDGATLSEDVVRARFGYAQISQQLSPGRAQQAMGYLALNAEQIARQVMRPISRELGLPQVVNEPPLEYARFLSQHT